ncbi:Flp family type IVb pilin [Pseudoduganella violaceinigra]|uniref:Flp family type IVb pilin n=1 Tax=Pseudoduganella violaceinigra TaxID=246602 RepID=UPI000483CA68|nr:Flp family type IVb pilin [Pseudoduganella violaceinigra]
MRALSAVRRFIRDERGVTAIEYGLIAAVIAVAVSAVMGDIGGKLEAVFGKVKDALTPAP